MTTDPMSLFSSMPRAPSGRLTAPGFGKTFRYAAQSIRLRFGRCMITAACVVGAVAFLAYNVFAMPEIRSGTGRGDAERILASADQDFFDSLDRFTQDRNAVQKRLFVIALSLLVAFVGITNSMLMSIKERYREIATLKCLGAVSRYIRLLFLIEALLQGAVGSLLGLVLALLLHVGFQETPAPAAWLAMAGLACFGLGVIMTLIASVWPIRQALLMMPVEALRVEE